MHVAFFDLDKTIYKNHSFFEIAKNAVDLGRASEQSWLTIQELLTQYKNGQLSYKDTANKLLEAFANAIKGERYGDLYKDSKDYFLTNKNNFYPYFEQYLPELQKTHDVYLVTTNAQFVAQAVSDIFNLSGYFSTEYEVVNGIFTGKVLRSLANGKALINDMLTKYGKQHSLAVGDSENDISMLERVEIPICINPNDKLRDFATQNDWKIISDEDAQGYFSKIKKLCRGDRARTCDLTLPKRAL